MINSRRAPKTARPQTLRPTPQRLNPSLDSAPSPDFDYDFAFCAPLYARACAVDSKGKAPVDHRTYHTGIDEGADLA